MSQKTEDWRGKSIAKKGAAVVDRAHAPPMACLNCGSRVMPNEAKAHRVRCSGRTMPAHDLDHWEPLDSVVEKGVSQVEVTRLVVSGALRTKEEGAVKLYLVRDIEQFIDARRAFGAVWS